MSGIMRAPSFGAYFEIPYSGTLAAGDCILITDVSGVTSVVTQYDGSMWSQKDNIDYFSYENNVISFNIIGYGYESCAAFIPGPNHH